MALQRMTSPAFWSRWAVVVDGQRIGTVEKRGSSSLWYAHGQDGSLQGSFLPTRADAVKLVEEVAESRVPEGEYDPDACEVCGSRKRNEQGELLHYEEDCFK